MKITQLRNATMVIEYHDYAILVDPMLAAKEAITPLKFLSGPTRRNPLVELPDGADEILDRVTHCLITHSKKGHFDHLDRAATKWLKENNIPVFTSDEDAEFVRTKKGLEVTSINRDMENRFLNGSVSTVSCVHGTGIIGKLMAHGVGYFVEMPGEPSLYVTGDTILTDEVRKFITQQQPDVIVLPAGGARFDFGGEVIMGVEDALEVAALSNGRVVANHLEALDQCPVTRAQLLYAVTKQGLNERFFIPDDGEQLIFASSKKCKN